MFGGLTWFWYVVNKLGLIEIAVVVTGMPVILLRGSLQFIMLQWEYMRDHKHCATAKQRISLLQSPSVPFFQSVTIFNHLACFLFSFFSSLMQSLLLFFPSTSSLFSEILSLSLSLTNTGVLLISLSACFSCSDHSQQPPWSSADFVLCNHFVTPPQTIHVIHHGVQKSKRMMQTLDPSPSLSLWLCRRWRPWPRDDSQLPRWSSAKHLPDQEAHPGMSKHTYNPLS